MLDYTSIKLAQEANTFKAHKKANTFKVTFAKEMGTIEVVGGTLRYFKGDALISGFNGEVWPANRQYFENSYTPRAPIVMGEDGDYQTKPIEVHALALKQDCQVTLHNGDTLMGAPGDYLIQYPNGDYGIIADQLFDQLYQKPTPPQTEDLTGFDIFVSYSTKDKLFVDALIHKLEEHKIRCWYAPRDIPIGMEWPQAIAMAIRDAKLMLLVFSEHSNISPEIARELTLASSHQCTVIPVRIDDVMPSEKLTYHLSNRHWLDVHGQKTEKAVETILEELQKLTGQPPLINVTDTLETAPKSRIKKYTLIVIAMAVCLAVATTGGAWLIKYRAEALELKKYENSTVMVYTGANSTQVKVMPYDFEKDTYLVQGSNYFHPFNNYIFECTSIPRAAGEIQYVTVVNGKKYYPFAARGNNAWFSPHSRGYKGEIKMTFNETLSSKADPREFVKEFRKQLNKTNLPEQAQ